MPLDMMTCPHCDGNRKNYIIYPTSTPPMMKEKDCVLCGGTGDVPRKPGPPIMPDMPSTPPELWPLLIPLGIFVLFFFFLWL
jgi:hypothetical protein